MIPEIGLIITIIFMCWIFFNSGKKPEYLIIIPFIVSTNLFGFASSNFLYTKGLLDTIDYGTLITLFISISYRSQRKYQLTQKFSNYNKFFKYFFLLLTIILVYSILFYFDIKAPMKNFKRYLNYIDYFFLLNFFSYLTEYQIRRLINFIEVITLSLSFFYILNYGLGITIFKIKPYWEGNFLNIVAYRTFDTLPYFILFIIAKNVFEREISYRTILKLFILLFAIFLTYTRSLYLIAVILLVSPIILRPFSTSQQKLSSLNYLFKISFFFIAFILFVTIRFTANLEFFMSRLEGINSISSAIETSNAELRQNIIIDRINMVQKTNPIIGLGFFEGKAVPEYSGALYDNSGRRGYLFSGDQSIGNIIANLGFFGTAIFFYFLLFPPLYSIKRIFISKERDYALDDILIAASFSLIIEVLVISYVSTNLVGNTDKISFYMALIVSLASRKYSCKRSAADE